MLHKTAVLFVLVCCQSERAIKKITFRQLERFKGTGNRVSDSWILSLVYYLTGTREASCISEIVYIVVGKGWCDIRRPVEKQGALVGIG